MLAARTRGQPILALVLVLAGWVGARGYAWERALSDVPEPSATAVATSARPSLASAAAFGSRSAARSVPARHAPPAARPGLAFAPLAPEPAPLPQPLPAAVLLAPPPAVLPLVPSPVPPAAPPGDAMRRIRTAAGHQSMWLAATALMPLPPLGLREAAPARPQATPARRWSGDGWLLLRRNSAAAITPGPLPGTYGASQVGAVIRYRLDTASASKPSVYVRGAAALGAIRQQEAALGLSARPLAGVPLLAMAEGRVTRTGSALQVRPALALVTELPQQALPLGFAADIYAQGGYVGGRGPTAFIDGLARIERPLAAGAGFSLKAGAGAWAAAQRGASRVDVGPVASVTLRLGDTASARIEADWRFRVGGRAKPDSGPALTISTGF